MQTRTERSVKESFETMVKDPESAILPAGMLEYDAYSAFVHCWVARQMKDKLGQEITLELPVTAKQPLLSPGAAKAAENIEAISRQIIDRVMKIVDEKDPGTSFGSTRIRQHH